MTFPLPLSVKALPRPLLPRTLRGSKSCPPSWPRPIASVPVPRPANHSVLRLLLPSALSSCRALESHAMARAAARAAHFPLSYSPSLLSSLPAVVLSYPSPPQHPTMALPGKLRFHATDPQVIKSRESLARAEEPSLIRAVCLRCQNARQVLSITGKGESRNFSITPLVDSFARRGVGLCTITMLVKFYINQPACGFYLQNTSKIHPLILVSSAIALFKFPSSFGYCCGPVNSLPAFYSCP